MCKLVSVFWKLCAFSFVQQKKGFMHSLQSSSVCAISGICCSTLLIDFRWEIKGCFLLLQIKKSHSLMCLDCLLWMSHTLPVSLSKVKWAASYVLSTSCCIFAAVKKSGVDHSRGTQCYSNSVTLPSFLTFSKSLQEQLSGWRSSLYQVKRRMKFWI